MIDRLAMVLFKRDDDLLGARLGKWGEAADHAKDLYREEARAALEAMREPTEAMIEAGWAHIDIGVGQIQDGPADVFNAMIDTALKD